MALRLVERGVRVVQVYFGPGQPWDSHYDIMAHKKLAREADPAMASLLADLKGRGLLDETLVIAVGEFGRTPKINKGVGRDHWPRVSFALLGGGSSNHGQVIGATDRLAGEPVARPVKFSELFATLYNHLGLDVSTATVDDFQGRPHYLGADGAAPIRELL